MKLELNMQTVKDLALDVWEDLGRTRLAGAAIALAVALLAITGFAFRPSGTPEPGTTAPTAAPAVSEGEVAFTVPGPEPMEMSDVDLSAPRDPFQSLDSLEGSAPNEDTQTLIAAGDSVQELASAPSTGGGSSSDGSVPAYDDTSSLVPLDDLDPPPAPAPAPTSDAPRGEIDPGRTPREPAAKPVTDYTYTVDIQFGRLDDLKRYASVHRLSLVPSRSQPLLMYLGVSTDRKTAVFMVDSRLSQGGEGECVPKNSLCTFLEMRATPNRDEHNFRDADGNEYLLRLRRVMRTSAASGNLSGRDVASLPGTPRVIDGAR